MSNQDPQETGLQNPFTGVVQRLEQIARTGVPWGRTAAYPPNAPWEDPTLELHERWATLKASFPGGKIGGCSLSPTGHRVFFMEHPPLQVRGGEPFPQETEEERWERETYNMAWKADLWRRCQRGDLDGRSLRGGE